MTGQGSGVLVSLRSGLQARVDEGDLPRVRLHTWNSVIVNYKGKPYAYSRIDGANVYLHRFILCPPKRLMVDHKNGDTLDNRRANLRLATSVLNGANSTHPVGRSCFRGVHLSRKGKFCARICSGLSGPGQSKSIYLGTYDDAETAARVWDAAARKRYGAFARLNFPEAA